MAQLGFRCYAKVNLTLEIVRRRPDGYHDLVSLVHTIGLADELQLRSSVDFQSHVDGLEIDPASNLVTRAAHLLATETGRPANVELSLIKRIPTAAGLGGGSSDAATALVGLNNLWETGLGMPALTQLGGRLGADVPFFLRGGAAVMRGRGEELEALPPMVQQWLVLIVPPHTLTAKTARLYAALEPADWSTGELTRQAVACVAQGIPLQPDALMNAFTRAARKVFPDLARVWSTVERVCDRPFFLSGAGPALFALATDPADARRQQTRLEETGLVAYAVQTVDRARTTIDFASEPPIT